MPVTKDDRQGGLSRKGAARAVALARFHATRDARQAPSWEQQYDTRKQASANRMLTRVANNDPSLRYHPGFVENAVASAGKIALKGLRHGDIQQGRADGSVGFFDARQLTHSNRTINPSFLPLKRQIGGAARDLANSAEYLPAGVYQLARHPRQTISALPGQFANDFSTHSLLNTPDRAALDVLGLASGGASVAGRVGEIGRTGELSALLRRPAAGMRPIHFNGERTLALNSNAPVARAGQRILDRVAGVHHGGGLSGPGAARDDLRSAFARHRFGVQQRRNQSTLEAIGNAAPGRALPAEAPTQGVSGLRQGVRLFNRGSRAAILYGKLGYGPTNILGQEWLGLTHEGLLSPLNRANHLRTTHALNDLSLARYQAGAGYGAQRAATLPLGEGKGPLLSPLRAVDKGVSYVDNAMADFWGRILDNPYRGAAFLHELRKQGIKTPEQISKALGETAQFAKEHPGAAPVGMTRPSDFPTKIAREASARKVLESSRRSNEAMIQYDQLGKLGRNARDYVFFLPWLKGSSLYAGHYLRDHPAQAALSQQLAQTGQRKAGLGSEFPSFMRGDFVTGHRNIPGLGHVPVVINPSSTGILGQSAQLGETAAAIAGLTKNTPGIDPSNYATPLVASLLATVYRIDPFTGRQFPGNESRLSILGKQLINQVPVYSQLYKGGAFGFGHKPKSADPTKVLFPRSPLDAVKQFGLSGLAGTPVNPVVMRSRYRAEQTNASSRPEAIKLRTRYLREDLLAKLRAAHRVNPSVPTSIPPQVDQAIKLQEQFALEGLKVAKLGPNAVADNGNLTPQGRLAAEVRVYGRMHGASQQLIDRISNRVLSIPRGDNKAVKQFAKDELPTILQLLGRWSEIKAATARLNAGTRKLPYANGGAPVKVPSFR